MEDEKEDRPYTPIRHPQRNLADSVNKEESKYLCIYCHYWHKKFHYRSKIFNASPAGKNNTVHI